MVHPKSDLGISKVPGVFPVVLGAAPKEKDCEMTAKSLWESCICQKKCGGLLLTMGLRKDIIGVMLDANFTCCSFSVKPRYGYNARACKICK